MDNRVGAALTSDGHGRTAGTVAGRLLAAMSESRPYAVPELLARLPHLRASTVAVELKRLVEAGRLVRVSRGVYVAVAGQPSAPTPRRSARDWIDARPAETRFSVYDAMAATGTSYAAADRLLRSRAREGRLQRLGGGIYAVPAAQPCAAGDGPGPRSGLIRVLMAGEARDWTAREIQDRLGPLLVPSSALPILANMARRGTVERVGPGTYRLAVAQSARMRAAPIEEMSRALEDILSEGGLWRVSDLVSAAGAQRPHVEDALRRLAGAGRAVHVVLNQWRSGAVEVDLERDGRTLSVRALGVLLSGDAVASHEIARRIGVPPVAVGARMRTLLAQDLAVEAGKGVYRCPPETRVVLATLLAPPGRARAA